LYADRLIAGDKVSNDLIREAHLLNARSAMALNDLLTAEKEYALVAKVPNSEAGAEAKFGLAQILFLNGNFKESQKKCFDLINQSPSYEFWIAKSFLLLGDNYLAIKDTFQAKATYKSLAENYEPTPSDQEDIIELAKGKLQAIELLENERLQREIEEKEKKFYGGENDSIQNIKAE
jgi:tetratricopeptide (TPR) repeat protein